MRLIATFFIAILSLAILSPVSAEVRTFNALGSESFSEDENFAIAIERARINAELNAMEVSSELIFNYVEDISDEVARALAGKIMQIDSSAIAFEDDIIYCSLVVSIDSDLIQPELVSLDSSTQSQLEFEQRFSDLEYDLSTIKEQLGYSQSNIERQQLLQRLKVKENEIANLRDFAQISQVSTIANNSRLNFFGYVDRFNESKGNIFFSLKDPASDSEIICTISKKLNDAHPEFKKSLIENSPLYIYGILTRNKDKILLIVLDVYR